ncbi:MAG: RnfABCDGE type electron transport complex subunit D [Gammaproteobacteria bacterium]|nr:RnfABCDGE type electron transport complex subunit D [Gammaproteobacteria bacterium]
MKFTRSSGPYWRPVQDVPAMMRHVLYALAPAAAAHSFFFGPGLWINLCVAGITALATEAIALRLRGAPLQLHLSDGSALVSAALLALCLPPLLPWWVTATGTAFAIGVVKHLYGGLGLNLFNPAMAGYALLLLVFPAHMTNWLPPHVDDLDYQALSLWQTLQFTATGNLPATLGLDAVTGATPLDVLRTELGRMRTLTEIAADPVFGDFGGRGWEWVGNFVTLGGLWLLYRGIIRWQIPAGMLAGVLAGSLLLYLADPQTHASPLFHLYAGGTLLGAFFIATDPVSACVTDRGRLIYGAGCGLVTVAIRSWAAFPDGVAFAVLLMNVLAPLIDRYCRPRVYGTG